MSPLALRSDDLREALQRPRARCVALWACRAGSAVCVRHRGRRCVDGADCGGGGPCRRARRGRGRCACEVREGAKCLTLGAACAAQGPRRAVREGRGLWGARRVSVERSWAFGGVWWLRGLAAMAFMPWPGGVPNVRKIGLSLLERRKLLILV